MSWKENELYKKECKGKEECVWERENEEQVVKLIVQPGMLEAQKFAYSFTPFHTQKLHNTALHPSHHSSYWVQKKDEENNAKGRKKGREEGDSRME
jgi:hypothetical protein